jgi:flagellar basal-body rod protein FlgC
MHATEISRTALDVEWRRLEIIAENLANANSARVGNGPLYQARSLVSGPRADFASYLDPAGAKSPVDLESLQGVAVLGITASNAAPRLVHEPGNPQANAAGFVSYPNIDDADQMTLMIKTSRAYEANIVMMTIARQMYGKALQLGERS